MELERPLELVLKLEVVLVQMPVLAVEQPAEELLGLPTYEYQAEGWLVSFY